MPAGRLRKLKSPMRMNKTVPAMTGICSGICFCLAIATVAAIAAMPVMAGNVLTNPGFESDPPGQSQNLVGWTWYGQSWGNTFNETGPDAHGGSNYFKVFQGFTGGVNYDGIYQDYF